MGAAGTLINTFVVVAVGAILTWITLDRHRQLRTELKGDIARLEAGLGGRVDGVEAGLSGIEGRLADLKGEIRRL